MEDKNRCPEKATHAVPWAGKILMGCPTHANDIVMVAKAIGSPVQAREIITNEPCFGQNDFKLREESSKDNL